MMSPLLVTLPGYNVNVTGFVKMSLLYKMLLLYIVSLLTVLTSTGRRNAGCVVILRLLSSVLLLSRGCGIAT